MTMQPEIVERLDDLTDLIETAKALPLSQSCMVPRAEMLDLIDDARASLPESVLAAEQVLIRRDQILADAQADADRLVGDAERSAAQMLAAADDQAANAMDAAGRHAQAIMETARTDADAIVVDAQDQARRTVSQAQDQAERMLADAEGRAHDMVANHTIVVSAKDEAMGILSEARGKAEMILNHAKRRASALLNGAEKAATAALEELRAGSAELAVSSEPVVVDLGMESSHSRRGAGAAPRTSTRSASARSDDFFDLEAIGGLDGAPSRYR